MVRGVRGDRVLRGTHRQIGCMWTLECPLTFADYFESKTSVCRFDPLFVLSLFDPAPIRLSVCCSPCAYTCVFVTVGQTNQKIVSIICPEERRSAHPLSGHVLHHSPLSLLSLQVSAWSILPFCGEGSTSSFAGYLCGSERGSLLSLS